MAWRRTQAPTGPPIQSPIQVAHIAAAGDCAERAAGFLDEQWTAKDSAWENTEFWSDLNSIMGGKGKRRARRRGVPLELAVSSLLMGLRPPSSRPNKLKR